MIDLLSARNTAQGNINQLLAGRKQQIGDQLSQSTAGIEQSRANALGPGLNSMMAGIGSTYGVNPTSDNTDFYNRKLGTQLQLNQAQNRFSLDRSRLNAIQDNAFRMADMAGLDRQSAEAFARQHMNNEIQRQYEAQNQNTARAQTQRQSDIENAAYQQQRGLQLQYNTPQNDVSGALARMLGGAVGTGLTAWGLYNMNKPGIPNTQTASPIATRNPYGPNMQTYGPFNPFATPY